MTKTKVMSFCPGDNVNLQIKAHFSKFTILKIEAIEVDQSYSNELNLSL